MNLTAKAEEASEETPRCIFNIMMVYDELAAGQRAMRLFDRLAEKHGNQIEFRPQIWRFDLAADPDWRPLMQEDAVRADLFILSMTGGTDLPDGVRTWLKSCLPPQRGAGRGLVALLGADGQLDTPTSPRQQFVRNLAAESGAEFFAPVSRRETRPDAAFRIIPFWSEASTPALHEISVRQGVGDAAPLNVPPFNKTAPNRHWGINE